MTGTVHTVMLYVLLILRAHSRSPTEYGNIRPSGAIITQYGSTVYIGIAMVYPHEYKEFVHFIVDFTFMISR